jgi:hypothetical protein
MYWRPLFAGVRGPEDEADFSLISSAEVLYVYSLHSLPLNIIMA